MVDMSLLAHTQHLYPSKEAIGNMAKDDLGNRKILHSVFFTPMGRYSPIGIVVTKNEVGEVKAYLGDGCGASQKNDEIAIACRGARIMPAILKDIIELIEKT